MGDCLFPDSCRAARSCYHGRGCRGPACTEANSRYVRERWRQSNRPDRVPRKGYVPAGRARSWLAHLRSAGIGYARIGQLVGMTEAKVWLIGAGRQPSIRRETEERLLAVMPSMVAPNALVDATLTHERIGVLLEMGWSEDDLARAIYKGSVRAGEARWRMKVLYGQSMVRRWVEDAVRQLYDDEVEVELPEDFDALAELTLMAQSDDSWRQDAECLRGGASDKVRQEPFFPTRGGDNVMLVAHAREICVRCPVRADCLGFALAASAGWACQGVWGGTTAGERRLIRRLDLAAPDVLELAASAPEVPLIQLLDAALERVASPAA